MRIRSSANFSLTQPPKSDNACASREYRNSNICPSINHIHEFCAVTELKRSVFVTGMEAGNDLFGGYPQAPACSSSSQVYFFFHLSLSGAAAAALWVSFLPTSVQTTRQCERRFFGTIAWHARHCCLKSPFVGHTST